MFSFRIVSVISLVLISFVLQSCTIPIVTITRNDDNQIVLLGTLPSSSDSDEQEPKETFSQLISSVLSPVFNKLLLLFLRELMSLMIGIEMLTVSAGSHFGMIPQSSNPEADLELHRSAMAVMELWLQLPTVENIESALQKATSEVGELVGHSILKDVPNVDPDISQKIVQLVLEKVEAKLQEDPITYKKFTDIKGKIGSDIVNQPDHHRTYFASGEKMTLKKEKKIFKEWFSHSRVKTFLVNKLFAENCLKRVPRPDSADYEFVLLAKSLVRLAKVPEKTSEVNLIYQSVVSDLAVEFDFEKFKFGSSSSSLGGFSPGTFANKTTPVLFERLDNKFKENSTLYTELLKERTNVIGDAFIEDYPISKTGFW